MKYSVLVGAMICIPSFIKIGSGIQNLLEGRGDTHADSKAFMSLLLFRHSFLISKKK
jgi:hypothetical protein